jgi:hypothetical protein
MLRFTILLETRSRPALRPGEDRSHDANDARDPSDRRRARPERGGRRGRRVAGVPSKSFAAKPDAWHRGDETVRLAEYVLSHHSERGDWPKDLNTSAAQYRGDRARLRGTFGNGATVGEMRFLGRAFVPLARPDTVMSSPRHSSRRLARPIRPGSRPRAESGPAAGPLVPFVSLLFRFDSRPELGQLGDPRLLAEYRMR